MQRQHRSIFFAIASGQFTYLLVSMGLLFVLSPFLTGIVWAEATTDVFLTLLFLSAIYAVKRDHPLFTVEAGLAVLLVVLRWWYHFTLDSTLALLTTLTGALFFVLVAISIIVFVFKVDTVTGDTIAGSVCAYLLLGLAWAYIFALLAALNPDALKNFPAPRSSEDLGPFIYFSLITLTTLGYGDIVPATAPARALAAFEAVTGQLYLTVLVARLVGLYGAVRPRR